MGQEVSNNQVDISFTISLEGAKKLYKDNILVDVLLKYFSKKELEKPNPVQSWSELGEIDGYYVSTVSNIIRVEKGRTEDTEKNLFSTIELANASLALAQLSQLMTQSYFNGDWKPDWECNTYKWCINFRCNKAVINRYENIQHFLTFETLIDAEKFLELYKELIEQAKPLL